MVPMLRQLLGEDVQLETDGGAGSGRIKVDPGQFEQVVMNLAVNARDAMPAGGRLRLTTSRVELAQPDAARLQLPPGPYMCLSAVDSGIGMDEATRARIFEPFFTTKPAGKGTGLGLSTVYGILQQSNGGIDVQSAVDAGTTFTVYLPVAESAPGRAPAPHASGAPRRRAAGHRVHRRRRGGGARPPANRAHRLPAFMSSRQRQAAKPRRWSTRSSSPWISSSPMS